MSAVVTDESIELGSLVGWWFRWRKPHTRFGAWTRAHVLVDGTRFACGMIGPRGRQLERSKELPQDWEVCMGCGLYALTKRG